MAELLSLILPVAVGSYLLGSIPFGYLLVRMSRGEDIRASGSGNIGATNVARSSPLLGVLTLVLDAAKGALAVGLTQLLESKSEDGGNLRLLMCIAALFAVVGHMFPVWLKFRGGKGVATGLGSFLLVAPTAIAVAAAVFVIVLALSRYVSLGSIMAVGTFPFLVWLIDRPATPPMLALITTASLLIVVRHHENIRRLLTHTESRMQRRSR